MLSELVPGGGVVLLLAKVTLVLTLTLVWASGLGRAPASTRHLLWLTCLSLLLAVPLVSTLAPTLRVLPLPTVLEQVAPSSDPGPGVPFGAVTGAPNDGLARAANGRAAEPAGARGPAWDAGTLLTLLLAIWGGGSALLLGRLSLSSLALRRLLRKTTPLSTSEWAAPLCEAADRLDLDDIPRLLLSEDAAMPFACGFRRPAIVLPAAAQGWSVGRRRAVLFHELAHVRRRDLVGHTVGRLVCALYWIHPMVWTAARRLRAESERACDDLALSVGIRPSEYADHLLQIVTAVRGPHAPAVALPFADRRELEGRVLAILDPVLRRGRPSAANVGALAALLLCGVAFSAVAPAVGVGSTGPTAAAPATSVAPRETDTGEEDGTGSVGPHAAAAALEALQGEEARGEKSLALDAADRAAERVDRDALPEPEPGEYVFEAQAPPLPAELPLLLRALADDPSPVVRKTAAWGLAGLDSPAVSAALTKALFEDRDDAVRETAAWALEADPGRAAGEALVKALAADASDAVRATAAWAIGSRRDAPPAALPVLERALSHRSEGVRLRAAWAIGAIGPASAPVTLYRSTLGDPAASVRLAAAWALAEIGDPKASGALLARLDSEPEEKIVTAILRALLPTRAPAALERLLRSPDADVRAQAVAAAGGADPRLVPWPWPWPDPRPMP